MPNDYTLFESSRPWHIWINSSAYLLRSIVHLLDKRNHLDAPFPEAKHQFSRPRRHEDPDRCYEGHRCHKTQTNGFPPKQGQVERREKCIEKCDKPESYIEGDPNGHQNCKATHELSVQESEHSGIARLMWPPTRSSHLTLFRTFVWRLPQVPTQHGTTRILRKQLSVAMNWNVSLLPDKSFCHRFNSLAAKYTKQSTAVSTGFAPDQHQTWWGSRTGVISWWSADSLWCDLIYRSVTLVWLIYSPLEWCVRLVGNPGDEKQWFIQVAVLESAAVVFGFVSLIRESGSRLDWAKIGIKR